jgi:hypothetical protein
MTEPISKATDQSQNTDRYKTLVVVLTVLTTVITTIVAGLQVDAGIRASTSNRDSQVYASLAAGELHYQDLQSAYNLNVFESYLKDTMESTILQMTALQQTDAQAAANSQQRALEAQARADAAKKFSIFFTDPRYAPKSPGGMPDLQTYITDTYATATSMVAQQNTASDDYHRWNNKGDAYTSILTILAIGFFLFGLAQAFSPRLRLLLAMFGLVTLLAAGFWTLLVLLT